MFATPLTSFEQFKDAVESGSIRAVRCHEQTYYIKPTRFKKGYVLRSMSMYYQKHESKELWKELQARWDPPLLNTILYFGELGCRYAEVNNDI